MDAAFLYTALRNLTLPTTLVTIFSYAFSECLNLRTVIVPT